MGKSQRTKGQRGEREACKLLREIFPRACRHLEFQIQEAEEGRDIDNTGDFAIQVKVGQQVPKKPYDFIEQIRDDYDSIPVVMMKRDRKRWLVEMYADDFIEMLMSMKKEGII
jgi:hypothetical protein|tara:strand:+ start:1251 stop:1589 length:339 start_codon:yes stop_codon:yes gene_type:complete